MAAPDTDVPLLVIRGGATDQEVAAVVAVVHALSAPAAPTQRHARRRWGAPASAVRRPLAPGPGGWRASSLP